MATRSARRSRRRRPHQRRQVRRRAARGHRLEPERDLKDLLQVVLWRHGSYGSTVMLLTWIHAARLIHAPRQPRVALPERLLDPSRVHRHDDHEQLERQQHVNELQDAHDVLRLAAVEIVDVEDDAIDGAKAAIGASRSRSADREESGSARRGPLAQATASSAPSRTSDPRCASLASCSVCAGSEALAASACARASSSRAACEAGGSGLRVGARRIERRLRCDAPSASVAIRRSYSATTRAPALSTLPTASGGDLGPDSRRPPGCAVSDDNSFSKSLAWCHAPDNHRDRWRDDEHEERKNNRTRPTEIAKHSARPGAQPLHALLQLAEILHRPADRLEHAAALHDVVICERLRLRGSSTRRRPRS